MEIQEMKDDNRYSVSLSAKGSVWKKAEEEARYRGISLDRFVSQAINSSCKRRENLEERFVNEIDTVVQIFGNKLTGSRIKNCFGIDSHEAVDLISKMLSKGVIRSTGDGKFEVVQENSEYEFEHMPHEFAKEWSKIPYVVRSSFVKLLSKTRRPLDLTYAASMMTSDYKFDTDEWKSSFEDYGEEVPNNMYGWITGKLVDMISLMEKHKAVIVDENGRVKFSSEKRMNEFIDEDINLDDWGRFEYL